MGTFLALDQAPAITGTIYILDLSRHLFIPSEVTPATEMGQLRQNFVLQSEAENEIYAGFLVSFSNQKPGMKITPALFGFPFS